MVFGFHLSSIQKRKEGGKGFVGLRDNEVGRCGGNCKVLFRVTKIFADLFVICRFVCNIFPIFFTTGCKTAEDFESPGSKLELA